MSFWEFFWNANENGVSAFGWVIITILLLVAVIILAGFIIIWFIKKFVWPSIQDAFKKIDKLFTLIEGHDTRIRNVEETIRAHEKSQVELEKNLIRQAKSSEQMVRASERITANMELNCMKYMEIVEIQEKSIRDLNDRLRDLYKEHEIRHAGETIKVIKPKSR